MHKRELYLFAITPTATSMPESTLLGTSTSPSLCELTSVESSGSETALSELLRRIASQDETALSELYDATVSRLFSLARAILRNPADAEEVVVDTFTQIWQTAARFDSSRGSVMGWAMTICRSRALDLLRYHRNRERSSLQNSGSEEAEAAEAADDSNPEELLHLFEQSTVVHRALASLEPVRRNLVALAFFRGLTHQEIAAITSLPVGTVKSHIRRALASLQVEIKKEDARAAKSR